MIYVPWAVFVFGIALLVWWGRRAKAEFVRRKLEEHRTGPSSGTPVEGLRAAEGQGQAPQLVEALAGHTETVIHGFGRQGKI